MFAQRPFVSQFICICSKLSFKNYLQQRQQSLLVSLTHSSNPTSINWAVWMSTRKENQTLQGESFVRLWNTWGLFNKTFSSNITFKTRGWMHQCAHSGTILSNKPDIGVVVARVTPLLPCTCWSLRCFPLAIWASLRWKLKQSSNLADKKIKCAKLQQWQQKICGQRLKRHQSAKPHCGWTHFWVFIVLKEKQENRKKRPFGFAAWV